jgi:sigma-B regulation protein RsbU (phosphoserine phosphatase)
MRGKGTNTSPAGGARAGRTPVPRSPETSKGDILVVDDVPANLRLLSDMLTEQGYKVRSVINGDMALMATRAAPPDLILLDINMPGMSGYQVCEHLKADSETSDIPIIFISALGETEDKVRAFTVGGVDYVAKPFRVEEVLARVETHLALRSLQAELQRANEELERRVEERTAQVVQLAVEKERMAYELQIAREVQAKFLPEEVPQVPGWEFAARWRPARQVAGDYYDFILGDERRLGLVIADVADKGVPAALFMVLTRSTLRASMDRASSPVDGITRTNRLLCADASAGMFVTLFYALLDPATGEIIYVNAGHRPPYLCRADSEQLAELMPTGMALGVVAEASFEQGTAHLDHGDLLVFYTDGVPEATDAQERMFGMERLERIVLDRRRAPAAEIAAAIAQAVDDFSGSEDPFDDVAIVVAKRL